MMHYIPINLIETIETMNKNDIEYICIISERKHILEIIANAILWII